MTLKPDEKMERLVPEYTKKFNDLIIEFANKFHQIAKEVEKCQK